MHPELLVRAISGIISPRTSIDELMANSMIFSKRSSHYLHLRGIGSISNGVITFLPPDRLKTALMALQEANASVNIIFTTTRVFLEAADTVHV